MKPYEIKKLINEIKKLNNDAHEKIFEIILLNDINTEYSEKENEEIYIDLSKLNDNILDEVKTFVNQYDKHIKYVKERDILYKKAKNNVDVMTDDDYTLDVIQKGIK